jgi:diguanylate cyclase (GGDEF)-like protein/PAS domain S-box-containing protein
VELFRTAFDEAPIGMCLVGPDGRFLQVNEALCRMLGYEPTELLERRVADITHPDDREQTLVLLRGLLSGTLDRYEIRKTNLRKDGSAVPVQVNVVGVRGDSGDLLYIVAQIQDLTRQQAAEHALRRAEEEHRRRLEEQARHDSLTGLPNRRELLQRLGGAVGRVARGDGGAATLFCDLDNFKSVNDTHGHAVGDELLIQVARRLQAARVDGETVCRFGGDEFVVLVPDVQRAEQAAAAAHRLARAFTSAFQVGALDFAVTVSIGVAFAPPGSDEDGHAMLRNADIAMYRAKAGGRNRVTLFTESLRRELLDRVHLEAELRNALQRRDFVCHYQPLVDLRTRRVFQLEALARWQHPTRGLVLPADFVPAVERAGYGSQLGLQVLQMATARAAAWNRRGIPLRVAVNLSTQQLVRTFAGTVGALLDTEDLPPDRLCLELTESAIFEAQSDGVAVLRDLAALGVRLAVDDFGTGYSSFAYLRDLPVHEVKIDRSFVAGIGRDDRDARVVAGMIQLARELGLHTVAEGVEDEAQLDALIHLGCDAAQGFHFARPSADPLQDWPALSQEIPVIPTELADDPAELS